MSTADEVTVRPLTEAETDDAVGLVHPTLREVPLYRWLLGQYLDDPGVLEWMAAFSISPHIAQGRVEGAFDAEGTLRGLVAWSAPDVPTPDLPQSVVAATPTILARRPDIVERLQVLRDATVEHQPPGDHVLVLFAAVDPTVRSIGVSKHLGEIVKKAAASRGMDILATTSDPMLGKAHERTYGAVLQKSYQVGDATIYQYLGAP